MSYANMVLYGRALPSYNGTKDTDKDNEIMNGDDPEQVHKFIEKYGD